MEIFNIQLSFRIKHPEESLASVAEVLEMIPVHIWTVGTQRKTPKGKILDGKYDCSYCCIDLKREPDLSVRDTIDHFLKLLEKNREYFLDLSSSGGVLSLVVFNVGGEAFTEQFDWQLLSRLSKLKISLGFD